MLNPDALTIGFARRFATYKRAPLIFQQLENIVRLTRDKARPIQFIFAGKAHPRDEDGKRYIQHIIHLSKYSDLQGQPGVYRELRHSRGPADGVGLRRVAEHAAPPA